MARSVESKKAKLNDVIQNAETQADLKVLFRNIPLNDLQSLFSDYVTNQASSVTVAKLYRCAGSLLDIVGKDCVQHALSFLGYRDMCTLSVTNKCIRDILEIEKEHLMSRRLIVHLAFFEFIYGEWAITPTVRFALQNKYSYDDLNNYSFDAMGKRGILKGDDLILWQICSHFGWNYDLTKRNDLEDGCYDGPFCDMMDTERELWNIPYPEWDLTAVEGIESTLYDCEKDMLPVLQVECPNKLWRDKFVSKNINGNMLDQLFLHHPMFREYHQWNEPIDCLIGYYLRNQYGNAKLRYPINVLGRKGILQGMDMIIWRLCQHFEFETRLYLRNDECSMIRPFPTDLASEQKGKYLSLDWNTEEDSTEWKEIYWDSLYGKGTHYNLAAVEEYSTGYSTRRWAYWAVIRIKCPPRKIGKITINRK